MTMSHIHTEELKETIKKIAWGVWLHAFNESKMTTPPTWLEDTVEPVDPNEAVEDLEALIDQALHQQSEIIMTWDCAEINDLWVVQFWKKEKDGSLTLIKQIDSGKGSMSLTSLSTEGAK